MVPSSACSATTSAKQARTAAVEGAPAAAGTTAAATRPAAPAAACGPSATAPPPPTDQRVQGLLPAEERGQRLTWEAAGSSGHRSKGAQCHMHRHHHHRRRPALGSPPGVPASCTAVVAASDCTPHPLLCSASRLQRLIRANLHAISNPDAPAGAVRCHPGPQHPYHLRLRPPLMPGNRLGWRIALLMPHLEAGAPATPRGGPARLPGTRPAARPTAAAALLQRSGPLRLELRLKATPAGTASPAQHLISLLLHS